MTASTTAASTKKPSTTSFSAFAERADYSLLEQLRADPRLANLVQEAMVEASFLAAPGARSPGINERPGSRGNERGVARDEGPGGFDQRPPQNVMPAVR